VAGRPDRPGLRHNRSPNSRSGEKVRRACLSCGAPRVRVFRKPQRPAPSLRSRRPTASQARASRAVFWPGERPSPPGREAAGGSSFQARRRPPGFRRRSRRGPPGAWWSPGFPRGRAVIHPVPRDDDAAGRSPSGRGRCHPSPSSDAAPGGSIPSCGTSFFPAAPTTSGFPGRRYRAGPSPSIPPRRPGAARGAEGPEPSLSLRALCCQETAARAASRCGGWAVIRGTNRCSEI
jgi:hypothetical protein